jgi:hypothetical protein
MAPLSFALERRFAEFAAWRYGEQFGRRRRKHALVVGGTVLGVAGIFVGAKVLALGAVVSPFLSPAINLTRALVPRVHVRTPDDRLVGISRSQLSQV